MYVNFQKQGKQLETPKENRDHVVRIIYWGLVFRVPLGQAYRIPESLRAFWRMVSFTAAKTSRMLEVSVAWVRLLGC